MAAQQMIEQEDDEGSVAVEPTDQAVGGELGSRNAAGEGGEQDAG